MDLSACEATVGVSEETRIQVATVLPILEAAKQVLQQTTQLAQALNEVAAANSHVSHTLTNTGEGYLPTNVQNAATGGRWSDGCCWWRRSRSMSGETQVPEEKNWLENTRQTLMIVAILIATVTFQAALNPPGLFWDDNKKIDTFGGTSPFAPTPVDAGTAINGDMDPDDFEQFMLANTVGLLASLSIILVLISPISLRGIFLTRLLVVIMWVAILAMAVAFFFGSVMSTPDEIFKFMIVTLLVFAIVIVLLFFGQIACFLCWCLKRLWGILKAWWLLKKGWGILKKGWGILRGMCTRGSSCSRLGCCQV